VKQAVVKCERSHNLQTR